MPEEDDRRERSTTEARPQAESKNEDNDQEEKLEKEGQKEAEEDAEEEEVEVEEWRQVEQIIGRCQVREPVQDMERSGPVRDRRAGQIRPGVTEENFDDIVRMLASRTAANGQPWLRIAARIDPMIQSRSYRVLAKLLVHGGMFIKHGRFGRAHTRWIWLASDGGALLWRRHGEEKIRGVLPLSFFNFIELGRAGSSSSPKHSQEDDSFFAFVGPAKKLNLQVEAGTTTSPLSRAQVRDAWARAFALMLGYFQGQAASD